MADHEGQQLTPRELVRAHLYPALATVSTVALVIGVVQLAPISQQARQFNACLASTDDAQQATLKRQNTATAKPGRRSIADCYGL
ncbi:MAG: hypothetical protein AB8E87_05845 [Prochlorococcus sp.]